MERETFLKTIQKCRHRLNMAEFLKLFVFALGIGAGVGILFQAFAFIWPIYYANLYTGLAVGVAAITAFVASYLRRSTMKQAALVMDSFGFRERIVTAYEHLNEEGAMVRLQREDALKQLQLHKENIQIRIWPSWKRLVCTLGLFLVMVALMLVPSPTKDRAKLLHQVRQEAQEKEEEIEEVMEELEELAQEALTPEQLAALQEMMETLQSSMEEYQQAASAEMLATAGQKLDYKYENMSSQLSQLATSLQNGAAASTVTAESMQAMAEQLQAMSGNLTSGNQQLASNQGQSGNGQNGNQSGQSGNGQNGNQSGQSGNGQNGNQNGQSGNGQNGNQNGQSGNGQNGNQSGQSGNGQDGGQGGQSGNGQGSGSSSGSGRGEGSSSALHDYVSIPNAIAENGNLTGDVQNHDNSQFFRTQNGISWEGTAMPYDAVIGEYEQNAYEGIATGQYPSGMEDVIKEYFASFN